MKKISVRLKNKNYPILIGRGLLKKIGMNFESALNPTSVHIITDRNVAKLYLPSVRKSFKRPTFSYILPAGETTKSFSTYQNLCQHLLKNGIDRKSLIIALGGGVIGDLAGFTASSILRGVKYIQVPTTLLSQVDSSIGGKTAIDTPQGKNLVGSFYHPEAVVIDPSVLLSSPPRQMKNGYMEILKTALIADSKFYFWLEKNAHSLFEYDTRALEYAIQKSCQIKARIVQEDETEQNRRAILNFGHTFGHAFEALSKFRVLHGEAVGVGLVYATKFSEIHENLPQGSSSRLKSHMRALHLAVSLKDLKLRASISQILNLMKRDKKSESNKITLVLLRKVGRAFVKKNIETKKIKNFLKSF